MKPEFRIHPVAEGSIAFLAAVAFFLLTDAIPIQGEVVPIVVLGGIYLCVVVVVARRHGPLYAVPLAIAGGLGFDSFYIPPTREFGAADWQNWLVIAIYISMGVLIGILGAHSQRRAEASELARGRLLEEQAALRRVAALIARETSPDEVFGAVAHELGRLLGVENTKIYRYEPDGTATSVADWGEPVTAPVGTRLTLEGDNLAARVLRTRLPARVDDYTKATGPLAAVARDVGIRFAVGTPIIVEGRLWGVMIAATRQPEPFPVEAESRIGEFTQLVATAISNADARAEVARLAEEQAALRRVATLVARGASPAAVFEAVATETAKVLASKTTSLLRYEPDATAIVVIAHSVPRPSLPSWIGHRFPLDGENVAAEVMRTGAPARIDDWAAATGSMAEMTRESGIRASVGVPIFVEGSLWGLLQASWAGEPPPSDTEGRMEQFAELADTAIANAESRAQLTASRARVLAAGDEARRRVVRDLHDGAQQRLVHTIVTLKLARRALRENQEDRVDSLVGEGLASAEEANVELRELAHGILPSVLASGGLRAGVSALVSRVDLPVQVEVPDERFPAGLEASAYFVVAEALTNVVKHARASRVEVHAALDRETLRVEVRDDGVGGAEEEDGSGLVGLKDRAAAAGGQLSVESPPGQGTVIAATLPAGAHPNYGSASGASE